MSLGSRLREQHFAASRAELEVDLAAGPDLFQFLPFGEWLKADHAKVSRQELADDQAAGPDLFVALFG